MHQNQIFRNCLTINREDFPCYYHRLSKLIVLMLEGSLFFYLVPSIKQILSSDIYFEKYTFLSVMTD